MLAGLAVFCILIVLYGALAVKLGRWSITAPMVFVAIGFLLGSGVLGWIRLSPRAEGVQALTEITLALVLFAEASTLSLGQVAKDPGLPLRLLAIGLPLTILLGAMVAMGLLPGEGLAFAAVIGAILAPTDAALGLPIFSNPRVPVRIRRALSVESGLNDGIATPFVALFVAFAAASEVDGGGGTWVAMALVEMVLGAAVGSSMGVFGGWLLMLATRRGWTQGEVKQVGVMGIALAAYLGSTALHGNGFIAAFIGGIVFSAFTHNELAESVVFTENTGTLLALLVWSIFGGTMLPFALQLTVDWRPIAYAILSLTVIRMVPVAIALVGAGLRRDTVALMGWFGPRGLASVVFSVLTYIEFQGAGRSIDRLVAVTSWTILLSVMAHGLSAVPLSIWYARRLASAAGSPAELAEVPELPRRRSFLT